VVEFEFRLEKKIKKYGLEKYYSERD